MRQLPSIVSIHRELQGKALEFISVSLDYRQESVEEAVSRLQIGFPVVFNARGWDDPLVAEFGVESIPYNVILDGELKIIGRGIFGTPLKRALSALAEGNLTEAQAVCQRAHQEQEALDEIWRLFHSGKRGEGRVAMEEFLEDFPDSEHTANVRAYLDSSSGAAKPSFLRPGPADLKPPNIDFPPEVVVPEFDSGSPGKMTSEYLRHVARALEAYREDTGAYPSTLSALSRNQAYLSEIPPDPFGGEFRYRTDGKEYWILAGRGPNRVMDSPVDQYRGDPRLLDATMYPSDTEGNAEQGDIVAYRSSSDAPKKAE